MRSAPRKSPCFGWTLALAATLLLSSVSISRAVDIAPYDDERDSNYIKILYRFIYPVGKVAEVFIFRPIHAFAGATLQPDPDTRYDDNHLGACLTFRPVRKCGRE